MMKIFLVVLFTTSAAFAFEPSFEPWGKDADLARKQIVFKKEKSEPCKTPILGSIGEAVIDFHQTHITSCDGPRSNFRPSSSQYMLDAMRKYGFFKGFSMGCDRLMRENADPWVYRQTFNEQNKLMKWDPVP
ncbi:MAG TPA: membrane protein insertion efficiency factor YidD [Parachlamydiaceae bacterium]|nr:membrane protein insertion efficiency factor YidD [Parachlamydiaceae bacterium]